MSSAKQYNLLPYLVIDESTVSGDLESSATEIFNKDNVTYQCIWTGTLVGTFSVQTSLNYNSRDESGDWVDVPLTGAVASGSADSGIIELNDLAEKWVKMNFDYTSGTGSLKVYVMGKAV